MKHKFRESIPGEEGEAMRFNTLEVFSRKEKGSFSGMQY
jgi:hypothetical protein